MGPDCREEASANYQQFLYPPASLSAPGLCTCHRPCSGCTCCAFPATSVVLCAASGAGRGMEEALHSVDGNVGMSVLWAHRQGTFSPVSSPGNGPQRGWGYSPRLPSFPYLLPRGMRKLGQFPIGPLRPTDSVLPRVQASCGGAQLTDASHPRVSSPQTPRRDFHLGPGWAGCRGSERTHLGGSLPGFDCRTASSQ